MKLISLALAATAALMACGGRASSQGEGTSDDAAASNGSASGGAVDAAPSSGSSSGSLRLDGSIQGSDDGPGLGGDSGSDSTTPGGDAGFSFMGVPVDAGYYNGNGSFWVEGGAYPQLLDAASQARTDAGVLDASSGCSALATCCATLTGSSQALCDSISQSGDATNCATELSQLDAEGNCTEATVLASQVQVPPNLLVSDGSLLFWTTTQSPALLAMPVGGGAITVLLSGPIRNAIGGDSPPSFLAVDDVNVYVLQNDELIRIPKDGSTATLVSKWGVQVWAATSLGSTAYWLEAVAGGSGNTFAVKSAALHGGPVSSLATFAWSEPDIDKMAVTSSTVFVGFTTSLFGFSLTTGATVSGPPTGVGESSYVTSDTNAIYWSQSTASNLRIGSDGTTTALGPAVTTMNIVSDDTYVYWVDNTTVGTIMKAPKGGGGTATVLARDTSPTAIAVDTNSVYWGDINGYVKSIPK